METRRHSSGPEWVECVRLLGLRLKELRLRAGLTQAQVAQLMGKTGPGGKSWVSQLEKGRFPEVGLSQLAAYLRACGAGSEVLADTLDSYTALPTVLERRAEQAVKDAAAKLAPEEGKRAWYYDVGLSRKRGQKVRSLQDIEKRVRQAVSRGRAERWERRLRPIFDRVLNEVHLGVSDPLAIYVRSYGRKVFGALRRTRMTRPVWREKALAKLDSWAVEHELPPEPFVVMKQAVVVLFDVMEHQGELD